VDRQTPEHESVNDRKSRGERADADGERCDSHTRESRPAPCLAYRVPEILNDIFEEAKREQVVTGLLKRCGIPELPTCALASLVG
jgi:hypothetical protein